MELPSIRHSLRLSLRRRESTSLFLSTPPLSLRIYTKRRKTKRGRKREREGRGRSKGNTIKVHRVFSRERERERNKDEIYLLEIQIVAGFALMPVNRQLISALKNFHREENWPAKLYTRLRIRVSRSPSSTKLFVSTERFDYPISHWGMKSPPSSRIIDYRANNSIETFPTVLSHSHEVSFIEIPLG